MCLCPPVVRCCKEAFRGSARTHAHFQPHSCPAETLTNLQLSATMANQEPAALPDHILRAIRGEVPPEEKQAAYSQSLNKCGAAV